MATNEDLMNAIQEVRADLRAHMVTEQPILDSARTLLDVHGDAEAARVRIAFINVWMERERDRADLRRAIIKHGTLLAMTAIVIFIFRAVWKDILELLNAGIRLK